MFLISSYLRAAVSVVLHLADLFRNLLLHYHWSTFTRTNFWTNKDDDDDTLRSTCIVTRPRLAELSLSSVVRSVCEQDGSRTRQRVSIKLDTVGTRKGWPCRIGEISVFIRIGMWTWDQVFTFLNTGSWVFYIRYIVTHQGATLQRPIRR